MKKRTKIIFSVLVVAAVLAATYRVVNRPPSASLESSAQMEEIIASSGCMACHTANPELPFYASLPVAGKLVKEDARLAYRSFDMTPMLEALKKGEKVSEVDLAKVEKVILDGTMPMAKYYLVHWGASLNDTEKQMALSWVKSQRAAFYPNQLAHAQWSNETIRPVQDSVPVDMRKVILGNLLFHDVRLSADNTVSCSSCHGLNTGGVDNKQFSEGVGKRKAEISGPTDSSQQHISLMLISRSVKAQLKERLNKHSSAATQLSIQNLFPELQLLCTHLYLFGPITTELCQEILFRREI